MWLPAEFVNLTECASRHVVVVPDRGTSCARLAMDNVCLLQKVQNVSFVVSEQNVPLRPLLKRRTCSIRFTVRQFVSGSSNRFAR
jgi:hypothetical protein